MRCRSEVSLLPAHCCPSGLPCERASTKEPGRHDFDQSSWRYLIRFGPSVGLQFLILWIGGQMCHAANHRVGTVEAKKAPNPLLGLAAQGVLSIERLKRPTDVSLNLNGVAMQHPKRWLWRGVNLYGQVNTMSRGQRSEIGLLHLRQQIIVKYLSTALSILKLNF